MTKRKVGKARSGKGIVADPSMVEVSVGAMAGIIALAKDVLQSDN